MNKPLHYVVLHSRWHTMQYNERKDRLESYPCVLAFGREKSQIYEYFALHKLDAMQCTHSCIICQLALRTACWINIDSQDRNILPLDYMHSSLFSHFILAWNLFLCLREYWEVPWGFALLWWGCIDKQDVSSRPQHSISLLDEFLDHRMLIRFRSIKMVNNLLWWEKKP